MEYDPKFEDARKRIFRQRDQALNRRDGELLAKKGAFASLAELALAKVANSHFSVKVDGVDFECLLRVRKGADRLIVFFSGQTKERINFNRYSWFPDLDAHVLNICDPMLLIHPDLTLGWYYGTPAKSFHSLTADLTATVASLLGVAAEKIILYGSSGGGYAALRVGASLPRAGVISINPQLFLDKYHYYPTFQAITGNDFKTDTLGRDKPGNDARVRESRTLILQNINDASHMRDHLYPLLNDLGIDPDFGLRVKNRVAILLYEAGGGHASVGDQFVSADFIRLLHVARRDMEPIAARVVRYMHQKYSHIENMERERFQLMLKMDAPLEARLSKIESTAAKTVYKNTALAQLYDEKGQLGKCLAQLEESLKYSFNNAVSLRHMMRVLYKRGKYDALHEVLKYAEQIYSHDWIYYYMARYYAHKGDKPRLKKYLLKTVAYNPAHAEALIMLATMSFETEDYDAALEYAEGALKANPLASTPWLIRAKVSRTRQNLAEALSHLAAAERANAHNQEIGILRKKYLAEQANQNDDA